MKHFKGTSEKRHHLAVLGNAPMFDITVPITSPTIPPVENIMRSYKKIFKSGMLTNFKYVEAFEESVKNYTGAKYAVATNSCMNGMMLILKILGLKGEIIMPSFTFHATAHAAAWNGLELVFVDCDPETYNIDPVKVEAAITKKTSAILGVHLFGNPADIESLEKIAKKHGLKLIFDAAHGFGTIYHGKKIGSFGNAESFSLSPTKLLTSGEGGMVTTNDADLAKKLRTGRNYGDPGNYDSEFSGFNARMSELHAALGIESIKALEKNVVRRNKMVELYKKFLSKIPGISFQKIESGNRSSYKDFSIYIDESAFGLSRDHVCEALGKENIITKKYFYPPVHVQKAFQFYPKRDTGLKITCMVSENSLSLPLFSHIPEKTIKKICNAVLALHEHADEVKKSLSKNFM
ncbi:DegT/DnrJ/EryC1/StrS family aminotransferase [Candidatus Peregrinibacteria bacterium]|nr:DegT/DnrJ/EryC1/StrS family aminotransferase [Candidatus Peregrinibacteria bacterium]